jgi:hypothetical protein
MNQGRNAQRHRRREERRTHPARRWGLPHRRTLPDAIRFDAVLQTPARYHRVSRRRPERPPTTSWRWRRAGTHRNPPVARRQPRGCPRAGTPPRIDAGRLCRRRQQRPAAARTPHTQPITDIPACAALGAHLNHRISLTVRIGCSTTMRAARLGQTLPGPPSSVTTGRPAAAHASIPPLTLTGSYPLRARYSATF